MNTEIATTIPNTPNASKIFEGLIVNKIADNKNVIKDIDFIIILF